MNSRSARILICAALLGAASAARADDWLDNLDESMRISFFKGAVTAQLSGLMDMEGYYIQQPTLAFYKEGGNYLLNPRLTLNLDVQITPAIYAFVETSVDRGFDPSDRNLQARLDQYAIFYKPLSDVPVEIQAGKFASIVGTYSERYDSWSNPFINAPLPYENLTSLYDRSVPISARQLVYWRYETDDAYERIPLMWGPSYASGIAVFSELGDQVDLAAEAKNASISSRPGSWNLNAEGLDHPTWSGHADWRPSPAWRFGCSGSIGPYILPNPYFDGVTSSMPVIPNGRTIYDYDQSTIAQDVTFAWRHWQLWAECFESRFDVPRVGNADTLAYYIEAKYKFTPQLFAALRWNQQLFSSVPIGDDQSQPWGNNIWRIDVAITYRWTERVQTKLQYSFTCQDFSGAEQEHLVAGQLTVKY